jgi:hypothetical protein
MTYINLKKQNLHKEMNEKIEKAQIGKEEPSSVDMTPEVAHEQEVPKEDAVVMPVRESTPPEGRGTEPGRKASRETTRPCRCPQRDDKWHDATFCSQRTRPGSIVNPRRNWPQPAERRQAVRKWHGTRETSSGETGTRTTSYYEPRKDRGSGGVSGRSSSTTEQ